MGAKVQWQIENSYYVKFCACGYFLVSFQSSCQKIATSGTTTTSNQLRPSSAVTFNASCVAGKFIIAMKKTMAAPAQIHISLLLKSPSLMSGSLSERMVNARKI